MVVRQGENRCTYCQHAKCLGCEEKAHEVPAGPYHGPIYDSDDADDFLSTSAETSSSMHHSYLGNDAAPAGPFGAI